MSRRKAKRYSIDMTDKANIEIIPLKRSDIVSVHKKVISDYLSIQRDTKDYIIVKSVVVPSCIEEVGKAAESFLRVYDASHKIQESKMAVLKSRITLFEASTDSVIVGENVQSSIDELKSSVQKLEYTPEVNDVEETISELRKNNNKLQSSIKEFKAVIEKNRKLMEKHVIGYDDEMTEEQIAVEAVCGAIK